MAAAGLDNPAAPFSLPSFHFTPRFGMGTTPSPPGEGADSFCPNAPRVRPRRRVAAAAACLLNMVILIKKNYGRDPQVI